MLFFNYDLITGYFVLNELKYKLLWIAASKKLNTDKKFSIISCIKKDSQLRNEVYSKYIEFYINLNDKFEIVGLNHKEEILSK